MVSRLKVVANRPVPPGKISFQIFQKDKRRLGGQVSLVVIVMSNGVVKTRVRLSGWVDIFESVVLTSRNLKKRGIIKEEDLYFTKKYLPFFT